jgi:hypothetical protein
MYESERAVFGQFKDKMDQDVPLREQVQSAIRILLSEYNTTIHENRFVVGGVLERIIGAAMRAAGISAATNVGKYNPRIDIGIGNGQGFSVKGGFTRGGNVRLINVLGAGEGGGWREASIFVLAKIGIAYADPELLPDATYSSGDAVLLRRTKLTDFLNNHPEYLIQCEVPTKATDITNSKMASETVASELLDRFDRLRQFK